MLADVAQQRKAIAAAGTQVAFVHMNDEAAGDQMLARHGLAGVPHVSDPHRVLYDAFGLRRGTMLDMVSLRVWRNAIRAILDGRGVGWPESDPLQMPGAFLVRDGAIVAGHRHGTTSDRLDYARLACGEICELA